jgi:hypothetical protein
LALQHHKVEIKIHFDNAQFAGVSSKNKQIKVYGNYIYLDKDERERMITRQMDFVITQVQSVEYPLETVSDHVTQQGGDNSLDLSCFNHPVKSIFFGFNALNNDFANDRFTFHTGDIHINGTPLLEDMSPMYFHTIQNYYKSKFGTSDFVHTTEVLFQTRYFAYHFCLNASDYNPSGTCNFSRIDNAKLILRGVEKGSLRPDGQELYIHAVNYNVLRIKGGMAGILFGN